MNNPLLSVIIPVYNAQDVLPIALDSILSQGISNMEIILVDDGSRDDSLKVCQQYARQDERIRYRSQANGGPGAARNTGLGMAKGQYISFVDSDDSMLPGSLRKMLDSAQKEAADMVIAHFNILINNQVLDRGYIKENLSVNRQDFLHHLAHRPGSYYYSALWNKLYSRRLIQEHNISFDNSFTWGEDFHFNMDCYRHLNKLSFLKDPVYNYKRTYSGQTWRTMFEIGNSFSIKSRLYKVLKELYQSQGLYSKYWIYIQRYIFNVTISH